jgi:hypothetical protein
MRNQTGNYQLLQALPGSYIALKCLENGHVTLPQNQPGKTPGAGTVYVSGTSQPDDNEVLSEVLQWNPEGTGGDRLGKPLTIQNFDNKRCYQISNGNICISRQKEFPNPIPGITWVCSRTLVRNRYYNPERYTARFGIHNILDTVIADNPRLSGLT